MICYPYTLGSTAHPKGGNLSEILTNPLVESIAKVSAFAIGAILAYACGLSIAAPLLAIAASMLIAQLVVKVCNYYNVKSIYEMQLSALEFKNSYPYLQSIAFLFALAVAPLSIVFASILATASGSFAGVVVAADHYYRAAEAQRRRGESGKYISK